MNFNYHASFIFFQNVFVHLTCECLKQLRGRALYSVIELERFFAQNPQGNAADARDLLGLVKEVLEKSTTLGHTDKVRLVALFMHQLGLASTSNKMVEKILAVGRFK